MDNKNLYIHIGTHKAGSTSIQDILENEKHRLYEEGICYMGRFFQISRIMREMNEYDNTVVSRFKQELQDELAICEDAKPHTYVVSNEKFSGHKLKGYKNAPIIAQTLYDVFSSFNFNIKIVVYLRRQDKFIESMYAQKIKSLSGKTFDEFLEEIEDIYGYHWDVFLNHFAEVFGADNIIVQSFDKKHLPNRDSLIQNFGKIINSLHLRNYTQDTIINKGYSRDVLEVARLANKHLKREESKILRDILTEINLPKDKYSFFLMKERKNLMDTYQDSNKKVVQQYFKTDEMDLFSEIDINNHEIQRSYEGLTVQALAVIFLKSILILKNKIAKEMEYNRKMRLSSRIKRKIMRATSRIGK